MKTEKRNYDNNWEQNNSSGIGKMNKTGKASKISALIGECLASRKTGRSFVSLKTPLFWSKSRTLLFVILVQIMYLAMSHSVLAVDIPIRWQLGDPKPGKQVPAAVAVDSNGNIFMTGSTKAVGENSDFYTIKMDSTGTQVLWAKSYDLANNIDAATAIVIDSQDNVIVTGYGHGGMNDDILTIKYDNNGALLWSHVYNGSGNGVDSAVGLTLDNGDDIYVAGYTQNLAGNMDYLIFKLTPNGANPDNSPIWEATHNGPGDGPDYITAITSDGNTIAVTGYSWILNDTAGDFDNVTRKYDLDGNLIWHAVYDSGTLTDDSDDRGLYIKIDSNGNVVVTGNDHNNSEIHTFKYTAAGDGSGNGVLSWDMIYDDIDTEIPKGLWVDNSGDVYVTGVTFTTSGKNDFVTVKYSGSDGAKLWPTVQGKSERIFNSSNSDDDIPAGITVDENGELFVAGYATAELDNNSDYATVKYKKSTGEELMTAFFDHPTGGNDQAIDVTVDVGLAEDGDVYVSGWSQSETEFESGTATGGDTLTVVNSSASWTEDQWNSYYIKMTSGPNLDLMRLIQDTDAATKTLSVNAFPNPVSGGDSYVIVDPEDYDYYVIKYIGNLMNPPTNLYTVTVTEIKIDMYWTDNTDDEDYFCVERCDGINCIDTQFNEIVCIPGTVGSGTIIQFNDADQNLTPHHWYTYRVKAKKGTDSYSYPSNEWRVLTTLNDFPPPSWTYIFDRGEGMDDIAYGVTVGPDYQPVITGSSNTAATQQDYYTVKLDRASSPVVPLWEAFYDDADGQVDVAVGVAVDSNNEVTVTGYSSLFNEVIQDNTNDLYTTKYASTGPDMAGYPQWAERYDGPGNNDDRSKAIATAVDGSNNIIVTGYGKNSSLNDDIYVVKYKPDYDSVNGNLLWEAVPFDSTYNDYPTDVLFDNNGDVVVIGEIYNASGETDGFISKYSGIDGTVMTGFPITNLGSVSDNGFDGLHSVDVDNAGNIYVSGYVTSANGDLDIFVNKYNSAGQPQWNGGSGYAIDGGAGLFDEAIGIAVDPMDDQVVVGGTVTGVAGTRDFYVIRYNLSGTVMWQTNLEALPRDQLDDTATAMAVDSSGYICIVGDTETGTGTGTDILAAKYDFQGNLISTMQFDNGYDDFATSVSGSDFGEFYVAGYTTTGPLSTDDYDFVVLRVEKDFVQGPVDVASIVHHTSASLTWDTKDSDVDGYYIFKKLGPCTADGTTFDQSNIIDTIIGAATYYSFDGLDYHDQDYCFGIQTYHGTAAAPVEVSRIHEVQITTFQPVPPDSVVNTKSDISTTDVEICWHDNTSLEDGFTIERCLGNCNDTNWVTNGPQLNAGPELDEQAVQTCITDSSVCAGQEYTYRVQAYRNALWASAFSYPAATSTTLPLARPTGLTASRVSDTQVDLLWNINSIDEDEFVVRRCNGTLAACTPFNVDEAYTIPTSTFPGNQGWYTDSTLDYNQDYTFQVFARKNTGCNGNGWDTAPSDPVSIRTETLAPTNVTAKLGDSGRVLISWDSFTDSNVGFRVVRCHGTGCTLDPMGSEGFTVNDPAARQYEDRELCYGTDGVVRYGVMTLWQTEWSDLSSPVVEVVQTTGQAPTNITAKSTDSEITLTWTQPSVDYSLSNGGNAVFDFEEFEVLRCEDTGGGCTPSTEVTGSPTEATDPSLLGWWRMDEFVWDSTLDEVFDSSGNYNHGTAYPVGATPTTDSPGKYGYGAGSFDGSNDYIDTGVIINQDPMTTTGATMMAWVNPAVYSSSYKTVMSTYQNNNEWGVLVRYDDLYIYSGGAALWQYNVIPAGQWTHVAVTWIPGVGVRIYVNGVFVNQVNQINYDSVSTPLVIGRNGTSTSYFNGMIDEVIVFSRPLSDQEIGDYKNNGSYHIFTDNSLDLNFSGDYIYRVSPRRDSGCWIPPAPTDPNEWNSHAAYIDYPASMIPGPVAPTGFNCNALSTTEVKCSWTPETTSETGYTLAQCVGDSTACNDTVGTFVPLTPSPGVGDSSYIDSTACKNTVYTYRIRAEKTAVPGWPTSWVYTTMAAPAPNSSAPIVNINSISESELNITWTDPNSDEDYFELLNCESNGTTILCDQDTQYNSILTSPGSSGFLLHYNMDESAWASVPDEVIDSSGNNKHGRAYNGANTGVSGKYDRGGYFDGTNDWVQTTLNIDQSMNSTGATFEAWVYPTLSNNYDRYVLSTENGGNDWGVYHRNSVWYVVNGDAKINTGIPVTENAWQHIAAVFEPGVGIRFYRNGGFAKGGQEFIYPYINYDNSDNNVTIGRQANSSYYFQGWIDEVIVMDRPIFDFMLYYKMNELQWTGAAGEVRDSSGNGNHGTSHNNAQADPTGKYGRAGLLESSTYDYVSTNVNIDQSTTSTGVTLEAWVYPTLSDGTDRYVLSTNNGGFEWGVYHKGSEWYVQTGYASENTSSVVNMNQWQHIAVSYDPGYGVRFFKNGTLIYTYQYSNYTAIDNDSDLTIGKQADGSLGYFRGWIDEVAVFDYSQMVDHYNDQVQVLSYYDGGLGCGVNLFYKVKTGKSSPNSCNGGWIEAGVDNITLPGPPPPVNLQVTCPDTTTCNLQWDNMTGSETGYVVKRCDGPISNCSGSDVWDAEWTGLPSGTESMTDDSVCPGAQYSYRVYAITPCGNTPPLDSMTPVPTGQVPSSPVLNSSHINEVEIDIDWTYTVTDETGYKVERCEGVATNCIEIDLPTSSASYEDFELAPQTEYCYRVAAFKAAPNSCNSGWQTLWSNQECQTTEIDPGGYAGDVTTLKLDTTNITAGWTDGYATETSWIVERCDGDLATCCNSTPENCTGSFSAFPPLLPGVTSYHDDTACENRDYTYRVRGQNEGLNNSGGGCWTKRVPITFIEFEPDAGVEIKIDHQPEMKADFSDIRFYDTTGKRELQYWIREYSVFNTATVWVMTGANDTIYLYYGNSSATDSSSTDDLFTEYDDFQGAVIDSEKWVEIDGNNKITQNNGLNLLKIGNNDATVAALLSRKVFDRVAGNTLIFSVNTDNDTHTAVNYPEYAGLGYAMNQEAVASYNQLFHAIRWKGGHDYYFQAYENGGVVNFPQANKYFMFTDYEVKIELIHPLSREPGARYSVRGGHYTDWTLLGESEDIFYTGDDQFRIAIMTSTENMKVNSISIKHAYNGFASIDFLNSVEGDGFTCYTFENTWNGLYKVADDAHTDSVLAIDTLSAELLDGNEVNLTWTPTTADEDEFRVERDCGTGYLQIAVLGPGTFEFTDPSPALNATCSYVVKAYKNSSCPWPDLPSNIASVDTATTAPLSMTATVINSFKIQLDWDGSATVGEDGFEIQMQVFSGGFSTVSVVGPDVSTYLDTCGINPNTSYVYRVRSFIGSVDTGRKSAWRESAPVITPSYDPTDETCRP